MQSTQPIDPADTSTTPAQRPESRASLDRLFHEINLLRLEGYYFCLDPKAAATRSGRQEFLQQITTSEGRVERALAIEPHPRYGYPSTLAYKVLLAITKKLTDYGYPVRQSVSFSQRELAALVGRRSFGGKDTKDFLRAVMQLKSTDVWGSFYDKDTEDWLVISFSILSSVIFSGRRQQVRECVVYLDPQIVRSLNSRYAFCLNYRRLEQLDPIGVALYKHLFFRFSYLHSTGKFASRSYTKDYAAICGQWLGGLKILSYKSKIMQEQLGRHLQALKDVKLIRSFRIDTNSRRDGFNVTFVAGSGFLEDYRDFYAKLLQPGLPFDRALDENTVQRPLELVRYFYERRYGASDIDEVMVSAKETDFARGLLESYSFEEGKALVDYALREAENTGFALQNFGGVRLYGAAFAGFQDRRRKHEEARAQERAAAEAERLRERYDAFRRREIDKAKSAMHAEELAAIERPIRAQLLERNSSSIGFDILVRLQINKAIEDRLAVSSFEEWRAREAKKACE
jgi:hypothetical protein